MNNQNFNPADWTEQSAVRSQRSTVTESTPVLSDAQHVELVISRIGATDITSDYDTWWKDCGMAFANTFGESGRRYFHEVSRNYNDYDSKECDNMYDYCLRNNKGQIGLGSFFKLASDHGIDITYSEKDIQALESNKTKVTKARKESAKIDSLIKAKDFLCTSGHWRHNVIKNCIEWNPSDSDKWERVTDYVVNTLWSKLHEDHVRISCDSIWNLLNSEFSPVFNPISDYLDSLPAWDRKTDYIGKLASMVHTDGHDEEFVNDFCKWFVGMVACWKQLGVNQQILVFVGAQGIYKTSWLNALLPECLKEYSCNHLNISAMTKDDQLAISQNLLINLDELDALSPTELNFIKSLATAEFTNVRQAYARTKNFLPRIASFCGSGNNEYLLTDRTGNRRWLVYRVLSIDSPYENKINHDAVYAQALTLLDSGFKFWFDFDEIRVINNSNQEFETPDSAEEFIQSYFRKPTETEGKFMTASDILEHCPYASKFNINASKIGKALKKLGYERIRRGQTWGYIMVYIDSDMRRANQRAEATVIYNENHPHYSTDDDDEKPF